MGCLLTDDQRSFSRSTDTSDVDQSPDKSVQRGGPAAAGARRAWPREMDTPLGLGWQIDHFVGYFALTSMVCLAWPRRHVGGAMAAFAVLLEGMQAFTPDRIPDLHAALYSAGGVLTAALPAHLFMRAPMRLNDLKFLMSHFVALRWSFWDSARTDR